MSGISTSRKRKRYKTKCSVCNRTFDDDYRLEHNRKYHPLYQKENKHVRSTWGGKKPIRSSQKETKPAGTPKRNQFCVRTGGKFNDKCANVMFHISCFFIRKFIIIKSSKCGILR